MEWMKHYGKASLDPRIEKVIDDMGCFGVGLYWRLCERIECWGNGSYPRQQLIKELKSRRLNSRHIQQLLDQYELFITAPDGKVSLASRRPGDTSIEKKTDKSLSPKKKKKGSCTFSETTEQPRQVSPSNSLQPSIGDEPTFLQLSVEDEPMFSQPSVEDEPTSPQPLVENEPTSPQPSVEDEPTSLQPSVENEPMSLQPSVEDEPTSLQPSVEGLQRACVRRKKDKKEINNNTNLPDWTGKFQHYSWFPYILPLLDSNHTAWQEIVCLQSGYGKLLMNNWENAVRQFMMHIVAYDTAGNITATDEARYYFNSFVKISSKSGQALKACLSQIKPDRQAVNLRSNPYLYEDRMDGIRYANGRPIPSSAPPRPSPNAVWNDACDEWSDFYGNSPQIK